MELHEDAVAIQGSGNEAWLKEQYPDGIDLKPFGEGTVEGLAAQGWTAELIMEGDDTMTMRMTRVSKV